MSKMIQIRNVPDELHREIKARAARAGMTLSDFLLTEVERIVETPPIEELLAKWRTTERPRLTETPADVIRDVRSAR